MGFWNLLVERDQQGPGSYPPEIRRQVIESARAGPRVKQLPPGTRQRPEMIGYGVDQLTADAPELARIADPDREVTASLTSPEWFQRETAGRARRRRPRMRGIQDGAAGWFLRSFSLAVCCGWLGGSCGLIRFCRVGGRSEVNPGAFFQQTGGGSLVILNAQGSLGVRLRGCSTVRWRRLALALTGLGLAAGGVGVGQARAFTCSQSFGTVTCRFSSTGAEQTLTVPAGVSSIQVEAVGAPGGKLTDPNFGTVFGGSGAVVTSLLNVTAQEKLYVEVGGAGGDFEGAPGFNGGARGYGFAAAGGGATDVRTTPRATGLNPDTRVLVAGGGGGPGDASRNPHPDTAGGRGGGAGFAGGTANGADFDLTGGGGGKPGSAHSGGSGGPGGVPGPSCNTDNLDPPGCTAGPAGAAGALGSGGAGAGSAAVSVPRGGGGGGGGGGLYGGGGGGGGAFGSISSLSASGPGGGGGGGSSLVPAGGSVVPDTVGLPPKVTITYSAPAELTAPVSTPRLRLEIAGPHAVVPGEVARYRIAISRSGPRSSISDVRITTRHATRQVGHWHIAALPFGHSRSVHLHVRVPSRQSGRYCITTTASATHARAASARDCVHVATSQQQTRLGAGAGH